MKKTAFILIVVTMVSKFLGFFRDITLSFFYGTSNISDAYLISLTIPTVIFVFIGTGINTIYIPLYNKIVIEKGADAGVKFTNNIINILILFCSMIVIMVEIYTTPIVRLFGSGFDQNTVALTVSFTRITIFGVYFVILNYVFKSYLETQGNFIIPVITGFSQNFIMITTIILSTRSTTTMLAIGIVAAIASQFILTVPFLLKKHYKYFLIFDIKDRNIKTMFYLSIPVVFGVSINQLNVLIDSTIASRVAVGGVSALSYANNIGMFIQGIFVLTFVSMMYPTISKLATEDNITGIKITISRTIEKISLFVIPASIGIMIFAKPIVLFLFGRGSFESQSISMTSDALLFYSIGTVAVAFREVFARAFYSLQDTKTPMINAALAMIINIILSILLSKYLGIGGIALATSLSAIICSILLFLSLRKKIGPIGLRSLMLSMLKICMAAVVMAGLSRLLYMILYHFTGLNMALLISVGFGVIIYFVIANFTKIGEVDLMIDTVKGKFRQKIS